MNSVAPQVHTYPPPPQLFSNRHCSARATEKVGNQLSFFRRRFYDSLKKLLRFLCSETRNLWLCMQHGNFPDIIYDPGGTVNHFDFTAISSHVYFLSIDFLHFGYFYWNVPFFFLMLEVIITTSVEQDSVRGLSKQSFTCVWNFVGIIPVNFITKGICTKHVSKQIPQQRSHIGI